MGLGFSLARRFGANGFQVAMVAHKKTKLDAIVEKLENDGIEVCAFPADITNSKQLDDDITAIKHKYGFILTLLGKTSPHFFGGGIATI